MQLMDAHLNLTLVDNIFIACNANVKAHKMNPDRSLVCLCRG